MKKSVLLCALAVFTLGFFSQANAAKVSAKEKNTKAMIEAIEKDNVADVIKYVKAGVDVNVRMKEQDNTTPIFYAAAKNYKDLVKLLLSKGSDINAEANDGYGHKNTPLTITIFAQQDKSADMVKFLLKNGADANYNKGLPLFYAIQYAGLDEVKALVEGGADVNIKMFETKTTPLHVAVSSYNLRKDVVEYLVSKGADIYAVEEHPAYTPFHYAIENYTNNYRKEDGELKQKQKEIFEFLLSKIDNIDMPNAIVSPLYLAAYTGDKEVIEALLAKGADINRENEFGTPIYAARDKETVEFLISKGAEVKYLRPAIILGDLKLVKKLVKEGDDLNRNINYSDTPLILALEQNQDKIAKYLISKGADVNFLSSSRSPLSMAVYKDNAKMVKYLISKGADVNKQDKYNSPALFRVNKKEIAEILIKNGADVNLENSEKQTALFYAARKNLDIVKYLVSQGAKINTEAPYYYQPLYSAVTECEKDVVEYLIENGADINKNKPEFVIEAIGWSRNDIAKLLITKGFDINSKDEYGVNALSLAVSQRNKEIVELLLDNGAEINVQNNYGKTPLDIAWTEDIKQMLISRGAKSGKDLK